ncbi:hypothetical protein M0804_009140 [Polistes exclamans]|nr:hypothetical protein M0804_009140 [Polistes exclamans]
MIASLSREPGKGDVTGVVVLSLKVRKEVRNQGLEGWLVGWLVGLINPKSPSNFPIESKVLDGERNTLDNLILDSSNSNSSSSNWSGSGIVSDWNLILPKSFLELCRKRKRKRKRKTAAGSFVDRENYFRIFVLRKEKKKKKNSKRHKKQKQQKKKQQQLKKKKKKVGMG